ncbi:bifunctional DNA primase/polymerase [Paraflavitalea sp. CAU 1676]|uniref:bifunctional DNA primase/polymerase n=1 Tax=Paraflavitalea sp. CAU 1676 TaxID=3032598 RepID=UPI0023D9C901|nr:bifunctional DNA primase/polymerase [Paraflavitalea sp. CAU 1676]MDF2191385.1 bifunctional DNA primase/polymerase [Paraflavitalea sp. CAU 1676]
MNGNLLFNAGCAYLDRGYSIVVVNSGKEPIHKWSKYQTRRMSKSTLKRLLNRPSAYGIAIVCGLVSNGIEVLDIDQKNDPQSTLFTRYWGKLCLESPVDARTLTLITTPNNGYHIPYLLSYDYESVILAQTSALPSETPLHLPDEKRVLIETRGRNAYFIAPPTPGYRLIQGSFPDVPKIEISERTLLHNTAKSFGAPLIDQQPFNLQPRNTYVGSPFDDFDNSGDAIELLLSHGWSIVRQTGPRIYVSRPGTPNHITSGNYHTTLKLLTVFSPHTPFKPRKAYRPYAIFCFLECQGDFSIAAKKLLKLGYGVPYYNAQ